VHRVWQVAGVLEDKSAAQRLCAEYGGRRVVLPVRVVALQARIRELSRGGMSRRKLRAWMQQRRVHQVLADDIKS
jgi:hypothetical protein